MILGVNGARLLGLQSGVGRATVAILSSLDALDHGFDEIRVYTPRPLPASVALPPRARNVVLASSLPMGLWEQLVLPRADETPDVLLCPSYVAPVLPRCPVVLIHHGSYEGYPEAFPWWPRTKARWLYAISAHRASRVCTVSEHSRRDIARYYGVEAGKVEVIPEGVDTRLFRPLDDRAALAAWRRRRLGDDVPFLLYVGKPTPRRNLPNLLAAFERLKREDAIAHKLLLIGTALPGGSLDGRPLHPDVVELGHAEHAEIVTAYNAADMLVYPSSYEGFGMPVLEAMACGTPAIALDNTAFPEFAGGVALLLKDAAVDTLAAGIRRVLGDAELRTTMKRDGPPRAAEYDWRKLAPRYVDLLQTAAGGRRRPDGRMARVAQPLARLGSPSGRGTRGRRQDD
jgi:glycosyltransferase involved in cell wall biosynthesis